MNGLKPIKMPSAKEKVAAELRKAILSRQMKEGEILSLDSVASQLNVSAMPVREAFQILARDGLIQLRKNKGAVVLGSRKPIPGTLSAPRDPRECGSKACSRTGNRILQEIRRCPIRNLVRHWKTGTQKYTDLNRAFHNEIWSAAGNGKMKKMISELWNGLSMGSMVSEGDYAKVSIKEHGRILKALQEHNVEAAEKEMYAHIMRSQR